MAKFDEEYSTWYYVDLKTKKSQWDAPAGTRFDSKSAGDDVPHQLIVPQNPNQGLMPQAVINHVRQLQIQIHKEITNKGLHKVNIINKAPQGQYYQQGPPQGQYYQQDHHRVSITNKDHHRTVLSTRTTTGSVLSTRTTTRSILPAATTTTTTKQSRFGGGAGSMALGVGGGLLEVCYWEMLSIVGKIMREWRVTKMVIKMVMIMVVTTMVVTLAAETSR